MSDTGWYAYLNQAEYWVAPSGNVRVSDMDERWRYNCMSMLVRCAANYETMYTMDELGILGYKCFHDVIGERNGQPVLSAKAYSAFDMMSELASEAFDQMLDERARDPKSWIKCTTLYKALAKGIDVPVDGVTVTFYNPDKEE